MSAADLTKGIEALEDEEIRAQVVDGDLSAFAELDLDDEEVVLLEGAASEYPEVVGFDIRAGLFNRNNPMGQKVGVFDVAQDITVNKAKTADKNAAAMDAYLKG
jgi:hypothetical protein